MEKKLEKNFKISQKFNQKNLKKTLQPLFGGLKTTFLKLFKNFFQT
jgi:hypothetical protein